MVETSADADALMGKLTSRQFEILSLIAIGEDGGHHPKVIQALRAKGLIDVEDVALPGRFPVTIKRYWVPVHIHIAWAQWASEQYDAEEE